MKIGNIDLVSTSITNVEDYIGTIGFVTNNYKGRELDFIALNCEDTLLKNVEVRQAINYAIDKNKINSTVFSNNYYVSSFPIDYGSYLYEPKFYYLYDELKKLQKIDYVIISCVDMKTSLFEEVVNGYLNNDSSFISLCEGILYKGIMKEKSVLLKDEVIHNE